MNAGDLVGVVGPGLLVIGIFAVAFVRFRSDVQAKREEAAEATLSLVTQHRDELQYQVDRQNIRLAGQSTEMEGLRSEIATLRTVVGAGAEVERLTLQTAEQHKDVMRVLSDIASLLGDRRSS